MLTLSNMRSVNSVKFKILLRVGNGFITSIDTDGAIIRKFNDRGTFIFKQWSCTAKYPYISWNEEFKVFNQNDRKNFLRSTMQACAMLVHGCLCLGESEKARKRERLFKWKTHRRLTFGCQQVIKQPSLFIDQRRNSSLSFKGNLIWHLYKQKKKSTAKTLRRKVQDGVRHTKTSLVTFMN